MDVGHVLDCWMVALEKVILFVFLSPCVCYICLNSNKVAGFLMAFSYMLTWLMTLLPPFLYSPLFLFPVPLSCPPSTLLSYCVVLWLLTSITCLLFFKRKIITQFYFMCIHDCLHMCMCAMCMPGAWSPHYLGQSCSLLWASMWMLGTKPGSFARAAAALTCPALSRIPALLL